MNIAIICSTHIRAVAETYRYLPCDSRGFKQLWEDWIGKGEGGKWPPGENGGNIQPIFVNKGIGNAAANFNADP